MKMFLFLVLLLLVCVPMAQGAICVSDTVLQYDLPYEDNTGWNRLKINMTCPNGCDNGRCLDENTDSGMIFIVGLLGIAALFFYVSFKFDKKEHGHIQTMFFMLGLIMTLSLVWVMYGYSIISGHPKLESWFTTLFSALLGIFIFMICYVMLLLLNNSLKYLIDKFGEKKWQKKG